METDIKKLIEKYYDGNTSLEEDKIIKEYFAQNQNSDELKHEKLFFNALASENTAIPLSLESDILEAITKQSKPSANRKRLVFKQIATWIAAAVVVLSVGFGWHMNQMKQRKQLADTFQTPEEAYQETIRVLAYVGSKINKAKTQLRPIGKIDDISQTLKPVTKVNNNLQRINQLKTITNPLSTNKTNK